MTNDKNDKSLTPSLTAMEAELLRLYHILDSDDKDLAFYFLQGLSSKEEYTVHVKQQDGTYSLDAYCRIHGLYPYKGH